jgi:hypothetical protein
MASMPESCGLAANVELMSFDQRLIVSKDQKRSLELRSRRNDGVDCGYTLTPHFTLVTCSSRAISCLFQLYDPQSRHELCPRPPLATGDRPANLLVYSQRFSRTTRSCLSRLPVFQIPPGPAIRVSTEVSLQTVRR